MYIHISPTTLQEILLDVCAYREADLSSLSDYYQLRKLINKVLPIVVALLPKMDPQDTMLQLMQRVIMELPKPSDLHHCSQFDLETAILSSMVINHIRTAEILSSLGKRKRM